MRPLTVDELRSIAAHLEAWDDALHVAVYHGVLSEREADEAEEAFDASSAVFAAAARRHLLAA